MKETTFVLKEDGKLVYKYNKFVDFIIFLVRFVIILQLKKKFKYIYRIYYINILFGLLNLEYSIFVVIVENR